MATEAPPPYHEAVDQIKKALDADPKNKTAFYNAFAEHMDKPETTDALVAEVQDLANGADAVDKLFFAVLGHLGTMDWSGADENLKDVWQGYYNEYNDLLKTSGKTATENVIYMNEFLSVVVPLIRAIKGPDDEAGRKEATTAVKKFLKKVHSGKDEVDLEKFQELADQHSDAFQKLREKIGGFKGKFKAYAKKKGKELDDKLDELDDKLKDLYKDRKSLQDKIVKLGLAIGITAFGTIVAGWIACAFLGPVGLLGALASTFFGGAAIAVEAGFLADAIEDLNRTNKKIDYTKKEQEDLRKEKEKLDTVNAQLESQTGEAETICKNIDRLRHVWIALAHESKLLEAALNGLADGGEDGFNTFKLHLENCEKIYRPLRQALEAYAQHKTIAGAKPNA